MNALIVFFMVLVVRIALRLRYRIRVTGLKEIYKAYGNKGVLFLPNHPGLIDPVIMVSTLWGKFHPRALVTEKQIKASILKKIGWRVRILPLPDLNVAGAAGHDAVLTQLDACVEALQKGDNLLLYPAGHIYHSKKETLRGNGGVSYILQKHPECKVVLVRTTGLWGSEFGRAKGYQQTFGECLKKHIKHVFLGLIFFMPRRHVSIEFVTKPADLPNPADKDLLNRYLEAFYNQAMRPNTYVPYTWFERGGVRTIPEPDSGNVIEDTSRVPAEVRAKVEDKLRELTGKKSFKDTDTLGTDLGLDSLILVEIQTWLTNEFGHEVPSPDNLRTVASVLLAAIGENASVEPLKPVPPSWFYDDTDPQTITMADSVPEAFLKNAKRWPNRPVWADQSTGVFTNRKMVLAVLALMPQIKKIPGDKMGILMPATAAANLMYLAVQFAGKVPVMINWTVGNRNMRHCIQAVGVDKILTARVLIERLKGTGVDFTGVEETFVMIEDIKTKIGLGAKLWAAFQALFCWHKLWAAKIPETAVILFTSGSETMPKAVPLTHKNLLIDVKDAQDHMDIQRDFCLLGMLPPFHSFGTLLSIVYPCASNIRVVYHPNPTEGFMLARLTAAYKINFFCGTPTFIANILRNGTKEQLETLRLCVTGAEKCPQSVLDLLHEKTPKAALYEGYGITECGPVVSLNRPAEQRAGTIGKIIPSTQAVVLDEACEKPVPPNTTGMLVVNGPAVFNGYLGYDGPSPFLDYDGKRWYKTGDLVQIDEDGYVTFKGRLKRFIKIGGEMISLPALEDCLLKHFPNPEVKGPALAVEAYGPDEAPVIVLMTTRKVTREDANAALRGDGFSAIQSIKEVRIWPEIPILGTGKTDYRGIKARLKERPAMTDGGI